MDLSKLTYSKVDHERTSVAPLPKATGIDDRETGEVPNASKVSPAYQKPEGFRPTSLIFVISGGEKKERNFLKELIPPNNTFSMRLIFVSEENQGLHPCQMQERWREIQLSGKLKDNNKVYRLDEADKVFLLSDVDEFYPQLKEIFNSDSKDQQGQWIVSNPCFEIWLYYCYRNKPKEDLKILISEPERTRSNKLKALDDKLIPGGIDPRKAFEHMKEGIENSWPYYNVDQNGIPVLFATRMYELAQYIVDTLERNNNEYSKYVENIRAWRQQMKR